MRNWLLNLGIAVGVGLLYFVLMWEPAFAQQAQPSKTDLATARQYAHVLLDNSMRYEAQSASLQEQVETLTAENQKLRKDLDEALAKLKEHEAPTEPPPPQEK